MKKAYVIMDNEEKITKEEKQGFEQLADSKSAQIYGVISFPMDMIMDHSEVLLDVLKNAGADYAFVNSPEFVMHEIQTNGKLAKMADKINLKIFDTTLGGIDLADYKQALPKDALSDLKTLLDLKQGFDDALSDMNSRMNQKHCAMIITKDADSTKIKELTEKIAKQGYNKFSLIEMSDFVSPMDQMYRSVISDNSVDKIVVADEYESIKFHDFLNQLEGKGMEITYSSQGEIDMTMKSEFKGMFMN
ncbi:hypothetical protein [[Clostridium] innocuum]|uniref:hypothetical protein n=1 Tax=Clostridium innocuum TaxID=1522 RepID=UPI000D6DA888|nr:hypothetical protein [[Clostridium] innocuum]PWJ19744.1 hypothetical protein ATF84_101288 [[Clostridium] innocuum]SSA37466.1 hypothetical protein SAMN04487929_101288 [[Clostridium] innocuum]